MRKIPLTILIFFSGIFLIAQTNIDSLMGLLSATEEEDTARISLLIQLGNAQTKRSPLLAIDALEDALVLINSSAHIENTLRLEMRMSAMLPLATAYSTVGENQKSVNQLLEILQIAEQLGDLKKVRSTLVNLGVEFQYQGMIKEALVYYRRALRIAERNGNRYGMAMALGNISTCIGTIYPDSTLWYSMRSLAIMDHPDMHDREGAMGWMMHNIGIWYEKEGQIDSALHYYQMSAAMRESIDHRVGLCLIYSELGEFYSQVGEMQKAIEYLDKSIRIGKENELINVIYGSYLTRSKLRSALNDYEGALQDHQMYMLMRDSVRNERDAKSLIQQTMTYEYQKKHLADSLIYLADLAVKADEVRQQKLVRNGFVGGFVLVALFAVIFLFQRNRISKEKGRSEELLLNILPEEIAMELKENGKADARDFEVVSIMFTDFKSFTEQSSKLSAAELVKEINHCFEAFDNIMEKYGIEKIKTIGDAYMSAGGLPVPTDDSVKNTVLAALEMQSFVEKRKEENDAANKPAFEMRVGIHTGPVVAGIVGVKKFQYDIWGDTVNTANRMESNGEAGKVNISQTTYELLKDDQDFAFESRGKIEAKGKGEIEMYFVTVNGNFNH
jgi:class 3 adenylate cyclase/Tfp pilus assembly protein PilF